MDGPRSSRPDPSGSAHERSNAPCQAGSPDWSRFWAGLAPFATGRAENFDILRETCSEVASADRGDEAQPIVLPMGLELDEGHLLTALMNALLASERWAERTDGTPVPRGLPTPVGSSEA